MTEDTETDEGIDDAFDAQNRFLSTNQTISMAFNLNFDLLTEDQNLFLSAVVLDEKDQVIVTTPLFNLENGYLTFYKGQVEIRNAYTTGGIRYIAVPLSGDGLSLAVGNYQTEVHLNDEVIGNLYWVIE